MFCRLLPFAGKPGLEKRRRHPVGAWRVTMAMGVEFVDIGQVTTETRRRGVSF